MKAEDLQTQADRVRGLLLEIDRPPWRRVPREVVQAMHRAYVAVREGGSAEDMEACAKDLATQSAKLDTMPRRYVPPRLTSVAADDPRAVELRTQVDEP